MLKLTLFLAQLICGSSPSYHCSAVALIWPSLHSYTTSCCCDASLRLLPRQCVGNHTGNSIAELSVSRAPRVLCSLCCVYSGSPRYDLSPVVTSRIYYDLGAAIHWSSCFPCYTVVTSLHVLSQCVCPTLYVSCICESISSIRTSGLK